MNSVPIRIILLGFGSINSRVFELLRQRRSNVQIVGVITRHSIATMPILEDARRIISPSELSMLAPDMIVEAASRDAVAEWGGAAVTAAQRVVLSSTSALTDDDLRYRLTAAAQSRGGKLVLSPGALAGIDALAAAARLGLDDVCHRIVKPPGNWPATTPSSPKTHSPTIIFSGPARLAASNYPQNANATVVTALAGIGLDKTRVELVSDPNAIYNRHEISCRGEFGFLDIVIANRPLPSNPKSSQLAALALVRLIENEASGVVL